MLLSWDCVSESVVVILMVELIEYESKRRAVRDEDISIIHGPSGQNVDDSLYIPP